MIFDSLWLMLARVVVVKGLLEGVAECGVV